MLLLKLLCADCVCMRGVVYVKDQGYINSVCSFWQSDLLLRLTELQSQPDEACATTLADSVLCWLALVLKLLTLLPVCPAHRCVKVEVKI